MGKGPSQSAHMTISGSPLECNRKWPDLWMSPQVNEADQNHVRWERRHVVHQPPQGDMVSTSITALG